MTDANSSQLGRVSDEPRRILDVYGEHEEEQDANAAELHVTVQGSSFFTGRAALKKAKEIAELVAGLTSTEAGVAESQIELESVRAEVKSGLLGKSSSALYQLRILCADLERLPIVLGVVTGAKEATLDRIHWRYPEDAESEGKLLEAAAARASKKAQAIARALEVKLVGPAEVREIKHDARDDSRDVVPGAIGMRRAVAAAAPLDLGVQIHHRKKVRREVRVIYLIG